jgi:phosphoribosyl 1,2-cyclic phosphate phosphodiesterase
MKLTFLGTGTSTGVPSIACDCETCTSDDPRDKRLRVSVLIEHAGQTVIVDTSSDFRQQALRIGLKHLDAVLITHCHADHIFGLDDIRPLNFRHGALGLYANERAWKISAGYFSMSLNRPTLAEACRRLCHTQS